MTEQQITKMMTTLKISREEAIDLIREDEEVDRMSMSEVDNDLTPEQKKQRRKLQTQRVTRQKGHTRLQSVNASPMMSSVKSSPPSHRILIDVVLVKNFRQWSM